MWKRILTAQRPFLCTKLVFVPSSSMVFSPHWMDRHTTKREEAVSSSSTGEISTLILLSGDFGFPQRKQQRYTGHIGAPKSVILGPSVLDPGSLATYKKRKKVPFSSHSWPSDLPPLWNDSAGKIQVSPLSLSLQAENHQVDFRSIQQTRGVHCFFYFFSHRYAQQSAPSERERDLIDIVWAATV